MPNDGSEEALAPRLEAEGSEVAQLRKQFAEKDHALLRANLSEADLRQRLVEAQDEIDKLRAEAPGSISGEAHRAGIAKVNSDWQRVMKSQDRQHSQAMSAARMEAVHLQQELERERRTRHIESARSSVRTAKIEQDLAQALSAAQSVSGRSYVVKKRGQTWTMVACTFAVSACVIAAWMASQLGGNVAQTAVAPKESAANVTQAIAAPKALPREGFEGGMGHLNAALSGYRGRGAQNILRAVHDKWAKTDPGLCSFAWNNGQPALVLSRGLKDFDMADALNRCASAVEKYRE